MGKDLFSIFGKNRDDYSDIDIDSGDFLKDRFVGFYKFIVERQKIWYRRFILKQDPPWTNDPYLRNYKFTNVYRELDKGTIYLIRTLKPIKNDRPKLLFNTVVYRLFNTFGFFETIGGVMDPSEYDCWKFIEKLDEIQERGKKLFSDAYLVPKGFVRKDYRPEDKHVQIAFMLDDFVKEIDNVIDEMDNANKPVESYIPLTRFHYLRDFISYEVWTDLTYFNFFKQGWTDDDFVIVGKGARWGLNIMLGQDTSEELYDKEVYVDMIYRLRDNMRTVLEKLDLIDEWMKIHYKKAFSNRPFLSLRNIEHSLCEYRKYWRMKYVKRTKKRYYKFRGNLIEPIL